MTNFFAQSSSPKFIARLHGDTSGTSLIEFAFIAPVLMLLGLLGADLAWMASVNMQVSQIALSLADNASRLGQTDNSAVTPTVTETDIDSIMSGAMRQGQSINLAGRGRVILSSLELDSASGEQYFHWQRCRGALEEVSKYGDDDENNGLNGAPIEGVGTSDTQIQANDGSAVMVAEVYYQHRNLFTDMLGTDVPFRQEAVFAIRDDRNLDPGVTGSDGESACE